MPWFICDIQSNSTILETLNSKIHIPLTTPHSIFKNKYRNTTRSLQIRLVKPQLSWQWRALARFWWKLLNSTSKAKDSNKITWCTLSDAHFHSSKACFTCTACEGTYKAPSHSKLREGTPGKNEVPPSVKNPEDTGGQPAMEQEQQCKCQ